MSITVETCGKAYCEHYPKGLPVCAKCREESTLAHDRACALLVEARAEIEMLKHQLEDESMRADGMTTAHAEACAKNYRQQELIEQMREAIVVARKGFKAVHYMSGGNYEKELNIVIAALAAERGNNEPKAAK